MFAQIARWQFLRAVPCLLAGAILCPVASARASMDETFPAGVMAAIGEPSPQGVWTGDLSCRGITGPVDVAFTHDWRTAELKIGLNARPVRNGIGERSPLSDYVGEELGSPPQWALITYDLPTRSGRTIDDGVYFDETGKRQKLQLSYVLDQEAGVIRVDIENLPECDQLILGKRFILRDDGSTAFGASPLVNGQSSIWRSEEAYKTSRSQWPPLSGPRKLTLNTAFFAGGVRVDFDERYFCVSDTAVLYLSTPYVGLLGTLPAELVEEMNEYLSFACPGALQLAIEYRLRSTPFSYTGPIKTIPANPVSSIPVADAGELAQLSQATEQASARLAARNPGRAQLSQWLGRSPDDVIDGQTFISAIRALDTRDGLQLPETHVSPCSPNPVEYLETNRYRHADARFPAPFYTAGFLAATWDCPDYQLSLMVEADEAVVLEDRTAWNGRDPLFGLGYSCAFDRRENLMQVCLSNPSNADYSNAAENGCIPAFQPTDSRLQRCDDPRLLARQAQNIRRNYETALVLDRAYRAFVTSILSPREGECTLVPLVATDGQGRNQVLGYEDDC